METTIPVFQASTDRPVEANPKSRKGLGFRLWTGAEDETLRRLVQQGLSDTEIAAELLFRSPKMIGYRRRLIIKDSIDLKKRKSGLNQIRLSAEERLKVVTELRQFGERRPIWWFMWRHHLAERTINKIRKEEGIERDETVTQQQQYYVVMYGRRQSAVLLASAKRKRVVLRNALVQKAAEADYAAMAVRQCSHCKTSWPDSRTFFRDYFDNRKEDRIVTNRCRACSPSRAAPGPLSTFNPLALLSTWQPFYYGLNSVESRLFVNKPGELEIVPCKALIELFRQPRRLPLQQMIRFTLDSAQRHGVLNKIEALDQVYFPNQRVFAAVVDELNPACAESTQSAPPKITDFIVEVKRFHAFLTLPYVVANHLG